MQNSLMPSDEPGRTVEEAPARRSFKAIVDCNSFYCSCERLFRPDLNHKPVVVLSNNDGCIVSRSDEAKKIGVEMAGPYFKAKPLIQQHDIAVFSSNYNLYGDMSRRVMEPLRIMLGEPNVEVYSVDEAFGPAGNGGKGGVCLCPAHASYGGTVDRDICFRGGCAYKNAGLKRQS